MSGPVDLFFFVFCGEQQILLKKIAGYMSHADADNTSLALHRLQQHPKVVGKSRRGCFTSKRFIFKHFFEPKTLETL
jgi:hypothetical protein